MYVEAKTLGLLGPEILLIAVATLLYVGGAFYRQRETWSLVALISYALAGIWIVYRNFNQEAQIISGPKNTRRTRYSMYQAPRTTLLIDRTEITIHCDCDAGGACVVAR